MKLGSGLSDERSGLAARAGRPAAKTPSAGGVPALARLLAKAGIGIDGERPWDLRLHDPRAAARILAHGSLGLGESYMDGWWDCAALDEFFHRVLRARLDRQVPTPGLVLQSLRARFLNQQSARRARQVGRVHYDIGNDFFAAMLDARMTYSCGYWASAENLDDAQTAKLDLICRKLGLAPGMRLLDIGCGWGSLMIYAARHYGISGVGLTISSEQAEQAQRDTAELPVEIRLDDYRAFNGDGRDRFDRIASIGMFEHVGRRNYAAFFDVVRRSLHRDGLCLLHTIGQERRAQRTDPWIQRYIFPNGELPALGEIADAASGRLVIEDVENFGADYDRTLLAWHARFETAWPRFADRYGKRFYRLWRYYLLSCAGAFRARTLQLWQLVMSPDGVAGGYRRPWGQVP